MKSDSSSAHSPGDVQSRARDDTKWITAPQSGFDKIPARRAPASHSQRHACPAARSGRRRWGLQKRVTKGRTSEGGLCRCPVGSVDRLFGLEAIRTCLELAPWNSPFWNSSTGHSGAGCGTDEGLARFHTSATPPRWRRRPHDDAWPASLHRVKRHLQRIRVTLRAIFLRTDCRAAGVR